MPNRRMGLGLAQFAGLLAAPRLAEWLLGGGGWLVHAPLHSMVETFGCVAALSAAGIELIHVRTGGNVERSWLAVGLIVMGLFDGLHAVTLPGDAYHWLWAPGMCVGGLLSAMVWLPTRYLAGPLMRVLPLAGLVVAAVGGVAMAGGDGRGQALAAGGWWEGAAGQLSVAGGAGFLAAAVYLLSDRRRSNHSRTLEGYCLALAAAGLSMPGSVAWGVGWWWWHLVQLAAMGALLARYLQLYLRSQRALLGMNDVLERKISERTASAEHRSRALEISQRALQQAVDSANTANLAKSRFLAHMSHEIRTPMNAILGMADLLWESPLNADQRNYVQVFRRAGQNLLALINDILDLSKIESGQFALDRTDFDLAELVERTVEIIRPRCQQKQISLVADLQPEIPRHRVGDPLRLQQVLMNLVGNAVKFTERGEVRLTVREGPYANELTFAVADTGIGIPEDRLQSIFEDFTQADASTTRRYGGTGLGLGIAQRLVRFMGGEIEALSVVGRGSTFRFYVQCERGARRAASGAKVAEDFAHHRVLVLDDNATNRMILRETLRFWGLESVECGTPGEALDELERSVRDGKPYSLVLLDRSMPRADGFSVASQIHEVAPGISIVMLTSDELPGDAALRRQHGITAFSTKPVKRPELLRILCSALSRPPGGGSTEGPEQSRGVTPPPCSGPRVALLVAEDSEENRILLEAYLKASEFALHLVEDGAQAVEAFQGGEYQLVLMDLQMPVVDGLEATRRIRAWEREQGRPAAAVIALTANALPADMEASRRAGCDAHLPKPVSKTRLITELRQWARRTQAAAGPADIVAQVPAGLEEFAPSYLAKRRGELVVMERLVSAGDWNQLRVLGHNMKGTGAGYGFPRLSQIGAALEMGAKQSDREAVSAQLRELDEFLRRVRLVEPDGHAAEVV
ncbi:MAG: response regulator [Acidobacteria bacterium]|nr:response regulator [Acidobacteriota bacterium]